jgi:3-deoxy-D-manno-octulosonic-acid transferase
MNNVLYRAYTWLGSGLFLSGFPPFFLYTLLSGRYGRHLNERLGDVPRHIARRLTGRPRIWLHAVSLGEIAVAGPIIEALQRSLPSCSILLSTMTEHGRKVAMDAWGRVLPVIYGPIDFVGSVRKAICRIRPDVLVFLETEIWPAWLVEAHRMGVRTALVNGRISLRSIKGYLAFRPFFREVLRNVDAFSMILDEDARRIRALGAAPEKVAVNGNAKFDVSAGRLAPNAPQETREILNLRPADRVLVAGSTREGEEDLLLDAYQEILEEFSRLLLIIAPRHLDRVSAVTSLLARRGLGYQLWGDLVRGVATRTERVVVVDTFGELRRIYSVGDIVFCGASLVPMGGHNPLEAAAWGKVVFYGPSMDDFQDAKRLLEDAGAGIEISSPGAFAEKALRLLRDPEVLAARGGRARQVVMQNVGAAERHARVIRQLAMEGLGGQ